MPTLQELKDKRDAFQTELDQRRKQAAMIFERMFYLRDRAIPELNAEIGKAEKKTGDTNGGI